MDEASTRPSGKEPIPDVRMDPANLAEDVSETDIPDVEEPQFPAASANEDMVVDNPDGYEETGLNPDEELDFSDNLGTTDEMIAVEEGIAYFPPTDPVVRPNAMAEEQLEVVGGVAADSDDTPMHEERNPNRLDYGDDELAQDVLTELRRDAVTTDLDIHVIVRNGVARLRGTVSSLDEAEAAEEVAGRVPGIDEVDEQLNIVLPGDTDENQRDQLWKMRKNREV